ncbi:hypothetical protein IQ249_10845 [Lusitaniella coriacea LEGE 07157]|uniref:Uncharacterized protein n=1 Tax=Lusitaniella coriacea LEGE 07157 TaxID=945747 RepID=A0A8J7DZ24_9CYAN|nr:hypothetical protein [Lusitaniella coriacea]MBE9116396.1 hypothetical protein [Lusitaniella coriacea LEGE 07157]
MTDFILIDSDKVKFNPAVALATVVVSDGALTGSGKATFKGKKVCVEGDEGNVSVPGCAYTMGSFSTPGTGTLSIDSLGKDQVAMKTKCEGKAMLLKGSLFVAKFAVQQPAIDPSTGSPDPNKEYLGNGTFETNNDKWKGT